MIPKRQLLATLVLIATTILYISVQAIMRVVTINIVSAKGGAKQAS